MSNEIDLGDDDVAYVTGVDTFGVSSTFQLSELKNAVLTWARGESRQAAYSKMQWFIKEGVKCKVLRTQGGGWKSGKFVFSLKFIPDELETPQQNTQSPLADLRSQLSPE